VNNWKTIANIYNNIPNSQSTLHELLGNAYKYFCQQKQEKSANSLNRSNNNQTLKNAYNGRRTMIASELNILKTQDKNETISKKIVEL
jgi:hypothetical protein